MSTAATESWRLPAEWEPQAGVMLTWPHSKTAWADDLGAVESVFEHITVEIARREPVLLVCRSTELARVLRERLDRVCAAPNHLLFAIADSDDTWARDHGPLSLIDERGGVRVLDFRFNGWGGKFPAARDDRINARLREQASFGDAEYESLPLILEGGAIETDGRGSLLATRHSIVTETRNPGLDEEALEAMLRDRLGIRRFLWLDHGAISGDDTDGHIDTLARFSDPHTLLYITAEPDDPDHPGLQAMRTELAQLSTANGKPYRLIALPPAGRPVDEDGRRLPATYANFLIINGAVLVPTYAHPNDEHALQIIRDAFPNREVIGIDCRPIIRQNGSLHCLTMQFPAALPLQSAIL